MRKSPNILCRLTFIRSIACSLKWNENDRMRYRLTLLLNARASCDVWTCVATAGFSVFFERMRRTALQISYLFDSYTNAIDVCMKKPQANNKIIYFDNRRQWDMAAEMMPFRININGIQNVHVYVCILIYRFIRINYILVDAWRQAAVSRQCQNQVNDIGSRSYLIFAMPDYRIGKTLRRKQHLQFIQMGEREYKSNFMLTVFMSMLNEQNN